MMADTTSSIFQPWVIGIALILYCLGLAIQRLFFSPIAHVPGPKLAALTLWYEFYYDAILGGQYTFKLAELHRQYGPIIRINPYEVHIDDPDFYDVVYAGPTKRRDRWSWVSKAFGIPESTFSTLPHHLHRLRRAPLNPFFSKKSIVAISPMLIEHVDKLCAKLREAERRKEPVCLRPAFSAMNVDIVMSYAFGRSEHCLDVQQFKHGWEETTAAVALQVPMSKNFPWILPLLQALPSKIVTWLDPRLGPLLRLQKDVTEQVASIIFNGSTDCAQQQGNRTIFHELVASPLLPASEKTLTRISDDGQSLVAGAEVTTTHYLNTTFYHILANPSVLANLRAELQDAIPDPEKLPPLSRLEQLPYLSAVIKEGHRISYGVTHRLQRISPDAPLHYGDYVIPAGTPVGMTSIFMHDNPVHFPEPHVFKPDRWLRSDSRRIEKYLVPYTKGTRGCLGQHLAQAEIHLTIAALIRRFRFDIYLTEREDIDVKRDYYNPLPRKGSLGLRVLVL